MHSTIMFTDIVGYSHMVAKNEKNALDLLDEHNEILFPVIKHHNGKIIKLIGDAIFARYLSSQESILAAIEIQNKLKDRNAITKNNKAIKIRVGVHSGEVIEKDDDLFGHDVNLCSRIESITQSGSITISEEIFKSVVNIEGLFHRKIGHVKLKNIPEPIILYKTYLDLLDYNKETDETLYNSFVDRGVEVVDIDSYKAEQIVSLGVLYFTNLWNESDEYYCYNFTKDLIDNLQSVNSLRVPSINEISKYKNINLSKSDLARKLEVNKLIQGSIFISDDKASMNLEIVDIDNGEILWEASLDIDLKKTLHIQNQVIEKILETLGIDIPAQLKKQFVILSTENPEAEREYNKARYLMKIQKKKEDLLVADKHLIAAIKHDPKFLFAHARRGAVSLKLGDYERAEELLSFALDIAKQDGSNISNGYVYSFLGELYIRCSKFKLALKYNKLALQVWSELNDHLTEANIIQNLGNTYFHLNQLNKALKYYKNSLRIKLKYENRLLQGTSLGQIGSVYLSQFNYSKAIVFLHRSRAIFEDYSLNYKKGLSILFISEAYIETGQFGRAAKLIKDAESVLDEYEDPTIKGRINLYKGLNNFYQLNIGEAISYIEDSIHQYQIAQKPAPTFNCYLKLIQIHMFKFQFDKVKLTLDKIDILVNRIKDNDVLIKYKTIKYLINILDDKVDEKSLKEILDQLTIKGNDVQHYITYWYLSLIFSFYNDRDNVEKWLLQSQKLLKIKSSQDSDKKLWNHILHSNPIHNQITSQKVETLKIITDSLTKNIIKITVAKFCTDCGYANTDLKYFCPECGTNLKS